MNRLGTGMSADSTKALSANTSAHGVFPRSMVEVATLAIGGVPRVNVLCERLSVKRRDGGMAESTVGEVAIVFVPREPS